MSFVLVGGAMTLAGPEVVHEISHDLAIDTHRNHSTLVAGKAPDSTVVHMLEQHADQAGDLGTEPHPANPASSAGRADARAH